MVNVCVMYYSKILKVTRIILFFGLSSSVNLAEEDNIVISYIVNYEEIYRLEEKIYELSQKILDDYQVSTTNEKIEFNAEKYFIGFKVIRIDEKNFLELKFNKKKIEESDCCYRNPKTQKYVKIICKKSKNHCNSSGTGSYPQSPPGLHFMILLNPKMIP